MFGAHRGNTRTTPTELDEELYKTVVQPAMNSSPAIRLGAPSIAEEVQLAINKRCKNNSSIMSIKEMNDRWIHNESTTPFDHYLFMMSSMVKNKHTHGGSREPVLKEEIVAALAGDAIRSFEDLKRMI